MITFEQLHAANGARKREWHAGNTEEWTLADWGNEMGGEAGEAQNVIKKLRRIETAVQQRGPRDWNQLVDHLMDELADVVICADLIALDVGRNLGSAVQKKFNATSEKHGLSIMLEDLTDD